MTFDKNGNMIQAGDIVEIKNAYFKNDNGFWFVEEDGTNEAYLGKDLTLKKIGKTGKISTGKYRIAFWPLVAYTSDRSKNYEAKAWNKENATIEITNKVSNLQVIDYFENELKNHEESKQYYEWHGYGEGWTKPHEQNIEYLTKALARMA